MMRRIIIIVKKYFYYFKAGFFCKLDIYISEVNIDCTIIYKRR